MTNLVRALDWSFSAKAITPEWCAARIAEGHELGIANLWTGNQTPEGAEQSLRYWREAGGLIGGYGAVHDGRSGYEHMGQAEVGAGAEWPHLSFCAVDCEEIKDTTLSPNTIVQALDVVVSCSLRPMIYTRGSYWRQVQNDTWFFASYPLWEAFFDGDASLHGAASFGQPFGGWDEPQGKQYKGTTDLDGVAVDFSVFSRTWLESLTEEGGRMPELTDEVRNSLDALRGWAGLLTKHPRTKRTPQAAKELSDASRVLDRAFGIGQ